MITRTDIINYLIWKRGYRSYLEIGLDDPELNFTRVQCEKKESVDPYDPSSNFCAAWTQADLNRFLPYLTYRMTSDDFFAAYPAKKYDVIFIDGLHLESQADRDIRNSLMHLSAGGVVVVHDCLPDSEASQSEDHPGGSWVGTVWKSMVKYTKYTHCDVKVLETDWGVGVIEYTDNLDFQIPEKLDLTYEEFNKKKYGFLRIYTGKLHMVFHS